MSDGRSYRRPLAAIAALGALATLGGCVAAAAIPVLAGGALAGTGRADRAERTERRDGRVEVPVDSPTRPTAMGTITRTQEYSDGSRVEVTMPARPPVAAPDMPATSAATLPSPSAPKSSAPAASLADFLPPGSKVQIVSGPLPAPGGASGASGAGSSATYAGFSRFAGEQGALPVAGSQRRSAMLAEPGTLRPETKECSIHPAAVMIDLDPAGATLDPLRATRADAAFAAQLAQLRAMDVVVAWVSSITADRAGAVRKALVSSGLDPAGRDELVLLRFPEERKQTRRQDIAKELCVVAIAGDERADFDELFEYLKDKSGAVALESLVGNGWFLIPTPLS